MSKDPQLAHDLTQAGINRLWLVASALYSGIRAMLFYSVAVKWGRILDRIRP